MATDAAPEPPSPPSGTSVIVPPEPGHPRKLSDEFAMILREFEVETVTLREVLVLLQGRGYVLLIMLLALPFVTPLPLPGVSTPFGLIIAIIGVRLVCGAKPWLPARLLDTRLSPAFFAKVFSVTRKVMLLFERLLRPRLLVITGRAGLLQLHAVPIVISAAILLLPLPIPFSNALPAWSILLLSAGLLERDGVFILAGHIVNVLAVGFVVFVGIFGVGALDAFWNWLK